jgi:hypothetical protein
MCAAASLPQQHGSAARLSCKLLSHTWGLRKGIPDRRRLAICVPSSFHLQVGGTHHILLQPHIKQQHMLTLLQFVTAAQLLIYSTEGASNSQGTVKYEISKNKLLTVIVIVLCDHASTWLI